MEDLTGHRRYPSLHAALHAQRTPAENQSFIERMLEPIPTTAYIQRADYIKVVRADSGPALEIHYGWSSGFRTEEEAVAAAGGEAHWPSARGDGLWGVDHPVRGHRTSEAWAAHAGQRDYGSCSSCFQVLPATGVCASCD